MTARLRPEDLVGAARFFGVELGDLARSLRKLAEHRGLNLPDHMKTGDIVVDPALVDLVVDLLVESRGRRGVANGDRGEVHVHVHVHANGVAEVVTPDGQAIPMPDLDVDPTDHSAGITETSPERDEAGAIEPETTAEHTP